VEPALTFLNQAATIELSRLVLQFPPNDRFADAGIARHLDAAENRQRTRFGCEGDLNVAAAALRLIDGGLGVGIAVVAKLVEGQLARNQNLRPFARAANPQRGGLLEFSQVV